MAENYKLLYEQMKQVVQMYQGEIVPELRLELEKRVEVVRCKDCKHQDDCAMQMVHTVRDYVLEQNISTYNRVDFCSCGAKMEGGVECE